jgi:hypothetical protein
MLGVTAGLYGYGWGQKQATACIIFTVLILAVNAWVWFMPEAGEQNERRRVLVRRIILGVMAVIAIGMIVVMIIIQTMITVKFLCLIYAIPVIVVNLYEYINPLLGDTKPMTRRRKILLGLLMVAGVIGLMYAFLPQLWLEYLVYLFVIPVMALNVWEWTAPEVMESMDGKGKEIISTNPQNPPKNGGQVCGGR